MPGEPRSRRVSRADGEATRQRILEAAGALFAERGFARTESKLVADRAQVDLASINYHFGSREGLLRATLIEAHQRIISFEDITRIADSAQSAEAKLDAFIAIYFERLGQGGQWPGALLARHLLVASPELAGALPDVIGPKRAVLMAILSEITAIPADAPELAACLLAVVAPCAMALLSRGNAASPLHAPLAGAQPADLARVLARFIHAGLAAAAADYARRGGG